MLPAVVIYGKSSFIASSLSSRLYSLNYPLLLLDSRKTFAVNIGILDDFISTLEYANSLYWFHCAYFVDKSQSFQSHSNSISINNSILFSSLELFNNCRLSSTNFVYLSSDRVGSTLAFDESHFSTNPIDSYGLSKAVGETIIRSQSNTCPGSNYFTLRTCSIYGPGQKNLQFIPKILFSLKHKHFLDLGDLDDQRSFLYIDDFVDAICLLISKSALTSSILHFSTSPIELSYIVECISKSWSIYMSSSLPFLRYGTSSVVLKSPRLSSPLLSDSQTRSLLQWRPRVSIEDGIDQTTFWVYNQQSP